MDIAAFISELLEHQEKLVVPGLGTFYRSRLDGYYSKEQQQFHPPSLQLQFSPEVQEDDGKLIAAITAGNQVSESAARSSLEKYVEGIIHLATTDTVDFGGLGTFSMRRNQLVFMPKKLNNNNELFYGLTPVKLRRNKLQTADDALKTPAENELEAAALLGSEATPGKPLNAANDMQGEEEEETGGKKSNRLGIWILIIALIILVSGIGLIFAYRYDPTLFDRFRGQVEAPPVSDRKLEREISDSIQHAIEAQKSIGLTPKIDSTTKSKILAPETPVDTFGIVVGKFSSIIGAKKEYDRASYTRYPVEIRKNPDGGDNPFQLVVATYFNVDSAKKHMGEYKLKLKLQDIIIQKYPYKKQQ